MRESLRVGFIHICKVLMLFQGQIINSLCTKTEYYMGT